MLWLMFLVNFKAYPTPFAAIGVHHISFLCSYHESFLWLFYYFHHLALMRAKNESIPSNIQIITGLGNNLLRGPVIRTLLKQYLSQLSPPVQYQEKNGTLYIDHESLMKWINKYSVNYIDAYTKNRKYVFSLPQPIRYQLLSIPKKEGSLEETPSVPVDERH